MMLSCNQKANDSMADTSADTIAMNNTNSQSSLDSPEQVAALLRAMELLVEMANADDCSTSSVAASSSTSTALHDACYNNFSQDSVIFQLKRSIERLQSTCRILQQEADAHGKERQRLERTVEESNSRIQTLEKAVKKLYKRNSVLQQTMRDNKEMMVQQVQQYVHETNQQHHEQQVLAHERLLKLENSSTRDLEEDDESCASSVSTMASCITDDGIATVCYDSPAPCAQSNVVRQEESTFRDHSTQEYSLQFPQGTKIGLQFHKMVLETKGLLDHAIQDDNEKSGTTTTPTKESSFRHFKIRGKHHDCNQHETAYVVCGHYGFDCDLNTAPSLGARLIKVNGNLTSKMSLEKIRASIQCTKSEFFSLTFRNEPLGKKQEEILKCAVEVTHQQYQEANDSRGARGRSVCQGGETAGEQHKNKPVIICMHDEGGPLRFSSFLHGARNRNLSDGDREVSNKQDIVVSPSTRSFYAILHGGSSSKMEEDVTDESTLSNSERGSPLSDDASTPSSSANRFASIFGISRSRTFSDNNVVSPEGEISDRNELSDDNALSPSGRSFYSILHGDTNAATSSEILSSPSRTTDDIPGSFSQGDEEKCKDVNDVEEVIDSDSRMSVLFNSVRRRTFSETADDLDDPSSVKPETEATDDVGTPETPRKLLSSFITGMGARSRVDSDPVGSDNAEDMAVSVTATSPLPQPADESPAAVAPGKFHTGIKSMGSRFKSWAPAAGKNA